MLVNNKWWKWIKFCVKEEKILKQISYIWILIYWSLDKSQLNLHLTFKQQSCKTLYVQNEWHGLLLCKDKFSENYLKCMEIVWKPLSYSCQQVIISQLLLFLALCIISLKLECALHSTNSHQNSPPTSNFGGIVNQILIRLLICKSLHLFF